MTLDIPPVAPLDPPRAKTPRRDRRVAIGLLLAGVACTGMGQSIVFAVLPPLGRSIGLDDREVVSIFLISAIFWVLLVPYWGRLSDRMGRKPFILLGLSGFALSMVLFATAIRLGLEGALAGAALYALIIATRSIYGLVGSATPGAAQGYIADRTTLRERTSGVAGFSAAFGLGAILGPGLGGAASAIGPLAPLYAVAGLGALMVAVIWVALPERTAPMSPHPRLDLRLADRRLRPFLLFGLAFGVINAVIIQSIGFYMIDILELPSKDAAQFVGIGLMAASMASLFSQLVLVQRFELPPHLLMRVGPCLIFAGHGLIAASTEFGPIVFGLVLSGFGAGMSIPGFSAAASLAVGPDEQGSAAGLANSASAAGFVIAPLIGFSLYALSPRWPFIVTTTLAACLIAYALFSPAIRRAGRSA
jgi:MFS family permease